MMTVRSLLNAKERAVWSVTPDTLVIDALRLLAEKNIGVLLVVNDGVLLGIFSERDYARKIVLRGESSRTTAVKDVMSTHVVSVQQTQSIADVMNLMTNNRIRHLPVMEDQKIIGIISIGDVVKAIISDQAETIKHLENYITGTP
jgi:CBS domain-containing protein